MQSSDREDGIFCQSAIPMIASLGSRVGIDGSVKVLSVLYVGVPWWRRMLRRLSALSTLAAIVGSCKVEGGQSCVSH